MPFGTVVLLAVSTVSSGTRITYSNGTLQRIHSTTRKYLGTRNLELDVTGANVVELTNDRAIELDDRFRDAIVLVDPRVPWHDGTDYLTFERAGARAVIRQTIWRRPGCYYNIHDVSTAAHAHTRGASLPWFDVETQDGEQIIWALQNGANVTLASTLNSWTSLYLTDTWMFHRFITLAAGIMVGIIAAIIFVKHRFTLLQALWYRPTIVSTVLLIETVISPLLSISFFFCHGTLFHTDTLPMPVQRYTSNVFFGCGVFSTKLMAMHWREIQREITTASPRADLWKAHKMEIYLTCFVTVFFLFFFSVFFFAWARRSHIS